MQELGANQTQRGIKTQNVQLEESIRKSPPIMRTNWQCCSNRQQKTRKKKKKTERGSAAKNWVPAKRKNAEGKEALMELSVQRTPWRNGKTRTKRKKKESRQILKEEEYKLRNRELENNPKTRKTTGRNEAQSEQAACNYRRSAGTVIGRNAAGDLPLDRVEEVGKVSSGADCIPVWYATSLATKPERSSMKVSAPKTSQLIG